MVTIRVIGALTAVALTACSANARSAGEAITTPSSAALRVADSTTTSAPSPVAPQSTPDQAAAALLDAWRHADLIGARRVATEAAVMALFVRAAPSISGRGCQQPISQRADCAFGLGGTELLLVHTEMLSSGGWTVASVDFEG